jgi:hypothetical protein
MAKLKQRLANVSANETGPAGDQYASWHCDSFRLHIYLETRRGDSAWVASDS